MFRLLEVIAVTIHIIADHGWVSRKESNASGARATADRVSEMLFNANCVSVDVAHHGDEAHTIIEWAKSQISNKAYNEYLDKIALLAMNAEIMQRDVALACSIVPTYRRAAQKIAEEAENAEKSPSTYQGTVGQRTIFSDIFVTSAREVTSDFGVSWLYRFEDSHGNVYSWFASRAQDFEIGEFMTVKATVKAHKVFRGEMQTQINRVSRVY